MSYTNYAENAVQTQSWKSTTLTLPWAAQANLWVMLLTASPTDAGTQTNEASYPNYARLQLTKATDITVSGNIMSNTNQANFNQANAATSQVLTYAALVDAFTAGNILAYLPLNDAITMANGVRPTFDAGALTFTQD